MEKATGTAQAGKYLTFVLNKQSYGVSIGVVREINRMAEITQVPHAPVFVAGVLNLRGKVIPVVDLRIKFGVHVSPYTKNTCIIVIEGDSGQIGMVVDSVSAVIDFTESQIEERPVMGNEQKMGYVMGLGKQEEQVVILVDIVLALSKDEVMADELTNLKTRVPEAA